MPSASLTVPSQSRKTLKTNKHGEKVATQDDKENTGPVPVNDASDNHHHNNYDDATSIPELPFPQTPAVRIPLEDLIGNTEDAFNCPPPLATPRDHVVWHNGPASSDPSMSVHGTQKSRKRARSSSPTSSQLEKSAHFDGQKDSMDLHSVQKSLQTPNNDPTQELWNRYMSANISRQGNGDFVLPSFSYLPPSSPQTPSTTSKDSALRRTVSCGIEWPTSKPKRRKIDAGDSHSRTKDIFAASRRDILAQNVSKTSRVGLLVEKIQEIMDRRQRAIDDPSSSSPLPGRHSQMPVTQASPTRSPSKTARQDLAAAYAQILPETARKPPSPSKQSEGSFSDFGGDELDVEFFESVENDMSHDVAQECRPPLVPATDAFQSRDYMDAPVPSAKSSPDSKVDAMVQTTKAHQPLEEALDDDFDDEDDAFAEELQDLADKMDSQNPLGKISVVDGPAPMQAVAEQNDELDDAFDDDDELWAQVAEETAQGKTVIGSMSQKVNNRAIKRYFVLNVFDNQYRTANGKIRPEKMLSLRDECSGLIYIVLLRQSWYETRCTKRSYVHIIGEFDQAGQCIVDDADNMIILHPDHLISATVVGDSFTCTRRAALQDRVKATSRATPPQVYGHILHEMFGEALRLNMWSQKSFIDTVQRILPSYLESLYEIGVSVNDATEYLLGKTPDLIGWASVFVGEPIVPDAVIRNRNGELVRTAISKLLELEEHIWSPMYGLKGNVDATVQAKMQHPDESSCRTLVVPLELKTGKKDNVESHRAQTALYTLLLSDRYDINVTCGVLYYMETSKTFRVESLRNEIRHMIIERNELACYVHDKLDLPPMLKKSHLCKACYSKTECFTYHKLAEGGDAETSGLGDTFNDTVGHLKPQHADFFKKWDDLLTTEERDTMKFRRELWTMLSVERQAVGRCFANVMIEPGSAQENKESTKINRFTYTFVKHRAEPGFSFTDSQITVGEPIVVSDEKGHFNLASGYVTNVRPTRIVVGVDRRLQNARRKQAGFDPQTNQVFTGLMESHPDGTYFSSDPDQFPRLYRIDKDEFANGMATARNNLIRIMEKDLFKARELRQLIIDGNPPAFKSVAPPYTLSGPASQQSLNDDQRHAIEKVMSSKDYALVLGMPGTGKTTTIAHIIRALVSQNKSVLLASYTHTAVDNILLKIRDDQIPVLRIGAVSKVHPEVRSFADLTGVPKKSIEELHKSWHESKVVATTCLGISHCLFNARTFDYCIVDEASQITLPVCLGPIRHARTFILVGDHYQLPPLVQNKQAQEGGLNVSLFKLLSDAHPESVVNLEHQYRMAEDIMLLSSRLVYNGRLKCGNDVVANRILNILNLEAGLAAHHYSPESVSRSPATASICVGDSQCWLLRSLSPTSRALFLNTDTISSSIANEIHSGNGHRITNPTESTLTAHLVTTLIRASVPPTSIGVITFYRSQLALLKRDIKAHAGSNASAKVEMHTADKYQGRDKEVVILSCVRSSSNKQVGELLKDWRRVNVAITRARSKLLVLGSQSTLSGSDVPILKGMVEIMSEKGWILDVPPSALDSHRFECFATQTQVGRTQRAREEVEGSQTNNKASPSEKSTHSSAPMRSPLQQRNANAISSPRRPHAHAGGYINKPFKKPAKVVNGKACLAEKLLEQAGNSVLRDVVNENKLPYVMHENEDTAAGVIVDTQGKAVVYGGTIESSPFEMDATVMDVLREMEMEWV